MLNEHIFEHSTYASAYNLGENVADVPVSTYPLTLAGDCGIVIINNQVAECFVHGWINSPGHHANMISTQYFTLGVGVACNLVECKATQMFRG